MLSQKKFLATLTPQQKKLRKRIIEMTHYKKTSHIGSCLSAVDIIFSVYTSIQKKDAFVLSSGHAALALYAVLEHKKLLPTQAHKKMFIHPDRNLKKGIYVSSGSLGHGLPIAVGMALSSRNRKVYCIISDGECDEGSIWESLNIATKYKLENLLIIVNANGFTGYAHANLPLLQKKMRAFGCFVTISNGHSISSLQQQIIMTSLGKPHVIIAKTTVEQLPFLLGIDAHYKIMTQDEYLLARTLLS